MNVKAENLGKKYGREWIFRDFNYEFVSGKRYAITGKNGSGKSTLLKILSAAIPASAGEILYSSNDGNKVPIEQVFNHLTFMAPYMELIEEFSLNEFLKFYTNFKPLAISLDAFVEQTNFKTALHKQIKNFSSGMKQRLQLGLALFTQSEVVFLDEPTSNLDDATSKWYRETVLNTTKERLVIISSNQESEYSFCDDVIAIDRYKY